MATTEQLNYFLMLRRYKTITEAAHAMHISPSGLSMSLKRLEDDLGMKLLQKKRNDIVFTEEGNALLDATEVYFDALFKIRTKALADEYTPHLVGAVELYTTESCKQTAFPHILPHMREAFPDLKITIKQYDNFELLRMLDCGEIPFAFLNQTVNEKDEPIFPLQQTDRLSYTKLLECRILYHVPNKYTELAAKASLTVDDLKDHILIMNMSQDAGREVLPFVYKEVSELIFEESIPLFASYMEKGIGIGQTYNIVCNNAPVYHFEHCYTLACDDPHRTFFSCVTNNNVPIQGLNRSVLDYIMAYTEKMKL